jgi:hypothetical protein
MANKDDINEPSSEKPFDWDELIEDLQRKRCILFLGPSLPIYDNSTEKYDFYSYAAQKLSTYLIPQDKKYDSTQSKNIYYTAQKYLKSKGDNRVRLEDKIVEIFVEEAERVREKTAGLPALYQHIAELPWHTVINTQPDNFLEKAFRQGTRFGYYHYRNNDVTLAGVQKDHFLVYNLFGCITREEEDNEYKVDSLVLTEEDQVDFVKNIVTEKPAIPNCIISRFDVRKRYIFLDFNLENWHFRLLLDALKLTKNSGTIAPNHTHINFSSSTRDFYTNRYGFVFVENNSEMFLTELSRRYNESASGKKATTPKQHKMVYIAAHAADEEVATGLIKHLDPWVRQQSLTLWYAEKDLDAAERMTEEKAAFEKADTILLLISADSLNDPFYSEQVQPAIEKLKQGNKKVIAVIAKSCAYKQTAIGQLPALLPKDSIPVNHSSRPAGDEVYKQIAEEIADILWPR